jgi:LCP family protein required for cell wall assembly
MAAPPSSSARRSPSRTWPQRFAIGAVVVGAIACFAAAGALAAGQWVVSTRNLVELADPITAAPTVTSPPVVVPGGTTPSEAPVESTTPPTFPIAEPDARNFLITGADNGACVDPDSPYAPAFGDRTGLGERSDTIMVWRVNPSTQQVAILSFPRDLYVDIAGGSRSRINSAYRRDDPSRLIETIGNNFGIPIDHYVQVDFCAFKRLVDGVGGVEVPFEFPARDPNTGLNVPTTGCFNFDGDHALAYVRSRKYQYEDPPGSGNWRTDGTSDLGRISRQQDFIRRTVATVLGRGLYTPGVVTALLDTNRQYLTTDAGLTPSRILEFAGVLRNLDPNGIASYQIENSPQTIGGQAVLVPRLNGSNMQAILAVFRGEATLAEAPEQQFESTTTAAPRPDATPETSTPEDGAASTTSTAPGGATTTTLPEVVAEENILGISPPRDVTC